MIDLATSSAIPRFVGGALAISIASRSGFFSFSIVYLISMIFFCFFSKLNLIRFSKFSRLAYFSSLVLAV
jgi:hypothetical protein